MLHRFALPFMLSVTAVLAQPSSSALTMDVVRIRSAPSGDARVLSSVPAGYPVVLLGCERAWCEVSYVGVRGFVPERSLDMDWAPLIAPPSTDDVAPPDPATPPSTDDVALPDTAAPEETPEETPEDDRPGGLGAPAEEPPRAPTVTAIPLDPVLLDAVLGRGCSAFASHADVQVWFDRAPDILERLDGDGDGVPCEELLASGTVADGPVRFRSVKEREKARKRGQTAVEEVRRRLERQARREKEAQRASQQAYLVVSGISALASLIALLAAGSSP